MEKVIALNLTQYEHVAVSDADILYYVNPAKWLHGMHKAGYVMPVYERHHSMIRTWKPFCVGTISGRIQNRIQGDLW